ncbi:MAG: TetR/AcrR family transcriptional regulator [Nannocystaceae bacterium]|nr:TetR/AcrR family transcriptional regulator [Nannocystaceae bacterium]
MRLPAKAGLHDEIIRVSIEIGAEAGEEGLTMRAIASRLGMSSTGIYQHFDSKASILREIRFHGVGMLLEALTRGTASTQDDAASDGASTAPEHQLRSMAHAYLGFARANPWLYRLLFDEEELDWSTLSSEEMRRALGPIVVTRETIAAGIARSSLRSDLDVDHSALLIWASLHGLASLLLSGRLSEGHAAFPVADLGRFVEAFVDNLMRSFAP